MACKSQVLLAIGMLSALSDHIALAREGQNGPNPKDPDRFFWRASGKGNSTSMYVLCMYIYIYILCVCVCVCYHAEVGRIWDFQTCSRFGDVFFLKCLYAIYCRMT